MKPISRRSFLALSAAGSAALATACSGTGSSDSARSVTPAGSNPTGRVDPIPSGSVAPAPTLAGPAFTLGVASGDPLPDRVVLWTRLAPKPLEGGGMPDQDVELIWEVAHDEGFDQLAATGITTTSSRWGHSAHVDAEGLSPDTWYFYRFRLGDQRSPVGRTRTSPEPGAAPRSGSLTFGFASCQEWTNGFYSAYPHMVDERLDLVVWLGDYMYEGGVGSDEAARKHNSAQVITLDEYRNRYALYSGDANLQAARAAQPWIVLWDDHEVENNYAGLVSKRGTDTAAFTARRAAAYQAWWENQPVRMAPPTGPDLPIHRTLAWGDLVSFFVLDERQHRDPQVCGNTLDVGNCDDKDAPDRSMLGDEQRAWFFDELDRTTARWNVIANEVIMTRMPVRLTEPPIFNLDQWDGFTVERRTVIEKLASRKDTNPLVITGDIHAFGMADLKVDWDGAAPVVGTEFVSGSITSSFPLPGDARALLSGADNVRYARGDRHGYAVMHLTTDEARCRFRAVDDIRVPTSPISTIAEFVVRAGTPGATAVDPTA